MTKQCEAAEQFGFAVSRETVSILRRFLGLVEKWNASINLIGRSASDANWQRHVADSAQLFRFLPAVPVRWVDLGSGAGFPGMIIAILARDQAKAVTVTLVESDSRKAAFLAASARELDLPVEIENLRIEDLSPQEADVISARALAPLVKLLGYAQKHAGDHGICLFPKGARVHKELEEAAASWRFDLRRHRSLTNNDATILEIRAITHVG